jgi:hypothetical protein
MTSSTGMASSTSLASTDAAERVGKVVQPAHLREILQGFLLARAQFARQFDDGIAVDTHAQLGQRRQHVAPACRCRRRIR